MSVEDNKLLARRLVEEAVGEGNLDVVDELAAGEFAEVAKRWVRPFRSAFPDFEMEIVELIGEGDRVVARFRCSGTHRGEWLGVPATGRRFENVDERLTSTSVEVQECEGLVSVDRVRRFSAWRM
jgi:predicted ester cyclase